MRLIGMLAFAAAVLAASVTTAQTPPAPSAAPASPSFLSAHNFTQYEQANEVELRGIAGFVRVLPENRTDIAVAVINGGPLRAPTARRSGRKLILDGRMRRQIRGCEVGEGGAFTVRTARNGTLHAADLPIIEIRTPQNVVLGVNGAVRLRVAPSQSAQIALEGCGDADVDRVEGTASVAVAGISDLRLAEAAEVEVALAGAGDMSLGVARDGLTVSIAGAGSFVAARADGPTSVAIQGAGDVTIRDGRATQLSVAIAGAGDVTHNGSAERLDAAIFGAGDVRVRQVSGPVSRRVLGGGEVIIGR
jgi:hypothetical protein